MHSSDFPRRTAWRVLLLSVVAAVVSLAVEAQLGGTTGTAVKPARTLTVPPSRPG